MATNDFQPFAYGGAANVVSQSAYVALTSILQNGFSSGVAQSAQLNKVWRQSSIMAAVLAQFSSDYSGQNSTDDGTTATLETNLIAAIRGVTKTSVLLTDTGTANAYTASNVPPLTSGQQVNGLVQQIVIAHANTGASTYAPDGLTAAPIYGLGLQPLQGGELALGGTAVLMRATIAAVNSGNPIWVLMECAGGAQQIAPATQSQHAAQFGQVQPRNVNVTSLSTSQTISTALSGYFIELSAGTITMPAATVGVWFDFFGVGGASGSIAAPAGVTLQYPDGTIQTAGTYSVGLNTKVRVISDGASWIISDLSGYILAKGGSINGPLTIAAATGPTNPAQLQQIGHGQCRFVYTSATVCTLLPFNGQNLIINGVPQKVPQAGVTLSNGGLAASTGYYVYAYMNGATMTLEAVTTAYTTGTNGVQVKNSDATRTLVGQIYTNASSQFQFSNSVCGVLTWFNQASIALQPINGTGTMTASSPTEINSALRVSTIVWSGKYLDATLDGFASAATSQAAVVTGIGIDSSTTINGQQSQGNSAFAGAGVPCSSRNTTSGSELTLHTFYALGYTSTGSGSWNLNMKVIVMA